VACYARLRRSGELSALTSEDRLFGKIRKSTASDGCWLWTGSTMKNGYGQLRRNGRTVLAHRYVYERYSGPIPDGLDLDHLCRVRNCVNPEHLEPVTRSVNVIRGDVPKRNGSKTHCLRGHLFDEENTYVFEGSRMCRACRRVRARERRDVNASPYGTV
jgi:hypothetical protein